MHYNYVTGEQWRVWHSISHRFPFWDKKDKHSALLLQEEGKKKKPPPAVSWEAVGCRMVSIAEAFCFQTMIRAEWGNRAYKVRKPPGLRCASLASWEGSLSPTGPCALALRSGQLRGAGGCLFLQGTLGTGGTGRPLIGSHFCSWAAAASTKSGGAGAAPRSGLGYAQLDSKWPTSVSAMTPRPGKYFA